MPATSPTLPCLVHTTFERRSLLWRVIASPPNPHRTDPACYSAHMFGDEAVRRISTHAQEAGSESPFSRTRSYDRKQFCRCVMAGNTLISDWGCFCVLQCCILRCRTYMSRSRLQPASSRCTKTSLTRRDAREATHIRLVVVMHTRASRSFA
jgi:hypothetical protein